MSLLQFCSPTRVVMGANALGQIGDEIRRVGQRVLVVTDSGVQQAGLLELVKTALNQAEIPNAIFDGVVSNPTIENVQKGLALLKQNQCDTIVAVGGGSPIDAAKAIAIVATNGGSVRDYEGVEQVKAPALPIFTIPTTVGTGSEVTFASVISDPERQAKFVIVSREIYPVAAFLDPQMVSGLPGSVCAATGMDALTHAIEGYISKNANPMTDALHIRAIQMVGKYLRPAVAGDKEALYQMSIASCIAGMAFHNSGLGLVHALANTAGGYFPIHHGVTNAIILPIVMEFNLISNPRKFADIAVALGENIEGLSEREAAGLAVKVVRQLGKDVDLPTKLSEIGIQPDIIPQMAQDALSAIDRPPNPRRNTVKDLEALYRSAL
jgi:alcohol dehydrogenase